MKGDMSLWILTKFAMIFFIFALALIITFFGKMQQEASCGQSADLMAKAISSRISQVVYAPVEDELRVYKMPPAIELGEGRARYEMSIVRVGDFNGQYLSISLRPLGMSISCGGGDSVSVANTNVVFVGSTGVPTMISDYSAEQTLDLHPSELENLGIKSKLLVVLKCSSKILDSSTGKPRNYLFLQDCTKETSGECMVFKGDSDPSAFVDRCCGWSSTSFCS